MPLTLRITDGTTTIELSQTAPVNGCTYFPQAAAAGDDSVTETTIVNLSGTDAAIRTVTNGVERMFEAARRRALLGVGTRIFAEYRPVSSDPFYRSEILDGRISWADNPDLRRLEPVAGNPTVQVAVIWERRAWPDGTSWEGQETELALSSKANASPVTGGVSIANSTDSTHGNWVQAASVVGSGPAPLRINLKNTSGSSQAYGNFWLATNAQSDPTTFTHILEGESRTAGYGTVTADGACSGGNYVSRAVAGTTDILWPLPTTVTQSGEGRNFRLLARLRNLPIAPIYATPMIKDGNGLTILGEGIEVMIPTAGYRIIDLGALPIPPGAGDATSLAALTFYLLLRCDTSATLELDYIQLTPTESLRHLLQRGYSIPNNDAVEDDGINGLAYAISGGVKYPLHVQMGSPVMVWPNATQRIYILFDSDSGASPVAATSTIRAYYRPRRVTG